VKYEGSGSRKIVLRC